MPQLIVCIRDREIDRFPIMKTWMTIGRDPSNDMAIDNESVSRFHAALGYVDGQGFVVEDRGSSNGITVNGSLTKKVALKPGDRVGIGKYALVLAAEGGVAVADLVQVTPQDSEHKGGFHAPTYQLSADVVKEYQQAYLEKFKAHVPTPIEEPTPTPKWVYVAAIAVVLALLGGAAILLF